VGDISAMRGRDGGKAVDYVRPMTTKPTSTNPASGAALGQAFETLFVETRGPGLADRTGEVRAWLSRIGAGDGLLTLFIRHTSASLLIQENADPDVHTDLLDALDRLAPRDRNYVHDVEGPDDMPAHIKSALTATSLSIPVRAGKMMLGTWQGIYVVEHRDRPHRREVVLHFLGTFARA
jgi:secondary thiamine-phosphate synthase enzyme